MSKSGKKILNKYDSKEIVPNEVFTLLKSFTTGLSTWSNKHIDITMITAKYISKGNCNL